MQLLLVLVQLVLMVLVQLVLVLVQLVLVLMQLRLTSSLPFSDSAIWLRKMSLGSITSDNIVR